MSNQKGKPPFGGPKVPMPVGMQVPQAPARALQRPVASGSQQPITMEQEATPNLPQKMHTFQATEEFMTMFENMQQILLQQQLQQTTFNPQQAQFRNLTQQMPLQTGFNQHQLQQPYNQRQMQQQFTQPMLVQQNPFNAPQPLQSAEQQPQQLPQAAAFQPVITQAQDDYASVAKRPPS